MTTEELIMPEETTVPEMTPVEPAPNKTKRSRKKSGETEGGRRGGGRPPKKPKNKVGTPIRFLTTTAIAELLQSEAEKHGMIVADYMRFAFINQLIKDGFDVNTIRRDATFEGLRQMGIL